MKSCFYYFEIAVRSISKSAEELFDEYGSHPGVSWEVRQEILAGKPLLGWDHVSIEEKEKIGALILAAEEMPSDALAGAGIDDLNDPAWGNLRALASEFLSMRSPH